MIETPTYTQTPAPLRLRPHGATERRVGRELREHKGRCGRRAHNGQVVGVGLDVRRRVARLHLRDRAHLDLLQLADKGQAALRLALCLGLLVLRSTGVMLPICRYTLAYDKWWLIRKLPCHVGVVKHRDSKVFEVLH